MALTCQINEHGAIEAETLEVIVKVMGLQNAHVTHCYHEEDIHKTTRTKVLFSNGYLAVSNIYGVKWHALPTKNTAFERLKAEQR